METSEAMSEPVGAVCGSGVLLCFDVIVLTRLSGADRTFLLM